MKREIDIDLARASLSYDPATGIFRWRKSNRGKTKAGDIAGHVGQGGYVLVKLSQVKYVGSRLAWAMHTGLQPKDEIDHINGNPSDNRFCNLREATRVENCRNRGFSGVRFEAAREKWLARIAYGGKTKNLGRYKTQEEALEARRKAEIEIFGEFARGQ